MKFNTYLNSRKSNEIWLEMGLFSIYYTIIGIIPNILVNAYFYWENYGLVFSKLVEPICPKIGTSGILR